MGQTPKAKDTLEAIPVTERHRKANGLLTNATQFLREIPIVAAAIKILVLQPQI